jgi:hypothetical protein
MRVARPSFQKKMANSSHWNAPFVAIGHLTTNLQPFTLRWSAHWSDISPDPIQAWAKFANNCHETGATDCRQTGPLASQKPVQVKPDEGDQQAVPDLSVFDQQSTEALAVQ